MISALLAAETVRVGYNSQNYATSLNEAHAAELGASLASTLTWVVTSW